MDLHVAAAVLISTICSFWFVAPKPGVGHNVREVHRTVFNITSSEKLYS